MEILKKISLIIMTVSIVLSCNQSSNTDDYETFGTEFSVEKTPLKPEELSAVFDKLQSGDTAEVVFTTKIDAVCQKKGCWMDVDLGNNEVARVTFLDYGFFVPLNSSGSEAIVQGKAFWKSETAAEKRHFAEDAGEEYTADDEEEEETPHIVATGVLIKK